MKKSYFVRISTIDLPNPIILPVNTILRHVPRERHNEFLFLGYMTREQAKQRLKELRARSV